jgi:hypothetical protein
MSDDLTQDQVEAQDQLQAAVENHIRAFRVNVSGNLEIAGDWMLIAGVTSLDLGEQAERKYAYHLGFSGGEQPEHTALGLLEMGKTLIKGGGPE